jgi:hypothetical protein
MTETPDIPGTDTALDLDQLLDEYGSAHMEYWTAVDGSPFEADARTRRAEAADAIGRQFAELEAALAAAREELAVAQREWKAWEFLANKAAGERNALRDRYEPTAAGTAEREAVPDGWGPFVGLLMCLDTPTKDGRILKGDGAFHLLDGEGVPLLENREDEPFQKGEVIGHVVGMWRVDGWLYAVGVARTSVASFINGGWGALGADLDAVRTREDQKADRMVFVSGTVRAVRLNPLHSFAWEV